MALPVEVWDLILVETESIQDFLSLACVCRNAAAAVNKFVKARRSDAMWMLYLTGDELKRITDKVNKTQRTATFGKRVISLLLASSGLARQDTGLFPLYRSEGYGTAVLTMPGQITLVPHWVTEVLRTPKNDGYHVLVDWYIGALEEMIAGIVPRDTLELIEVAAFDAGVAFELTRQTATHCTSLRLQQHFVEYTVGQIIPKIIETNYAAAAALMAIAEEIPAVANWSLAKLDFDSQRLSTFIRHVNLALHFNATTNADAAAQETLKQWQQTVIAAYSHRFFNAFRSLWHLSTLWQSLGSDAAKVADLIAESLRANLHHIHPQPTFDAVADLRDNAKDVPRSKRRIYDEMLEKLSAPNPNPNAPVGAPSRWTRAKAKIKQILIFAPLIPLQVILLASILLWFIATVWPMLQWPLLLNNSVCQAVPSLCHPVVAVLTAPTCITDLVMPVRMHGCHAFANFTYQNVVWKDSNLTLGEVCACPTFTKSLGFIHNAAKSYFEVWDSEIVTPFWTVVDWLIPNCNFTNVWESLRAQDDERLRLKVEILMMLREGEETMDHLKKSGELDYIIDKVLKRVKA